ncbi:MAG TPA: hypothetical protein VK818_15885 [Methylomirabilota bacterium]|nr:hypothetical protein [Methylomirabilota bacterium]
MTRYKQILGFPLLMLLLVCSTAICAGPMEQDGVITMTVRVANYDEGPVQILGLKHAEEAGKEPYVHLRNTSSVKTSRIWVRAQVVDSNDPQKVLSRTNSYIPNETWPAERMIDPGADVWAHETVLRGDRLVSFAKDFHTRCLSLRISVMRVDFVNGTYWEGWANGAEKSWTYADDPSRNEDTCKNSTSTKTEEHEFAGVKLWRDMPQREKFINWLDNNSYSISRPVMLDDGKYFPACPF